MKQNTLIGLLLALLLAGGVSAWLLLQKQAQYESTQAGLLFADLPGLAGEINAIQIDNSQGTLFSAQLDEQGWWVTHVSEGLSYPADTKALASLLSGVSQAKLREAKTAKKDNLPRLGLADIQQTDSQGLLMTFEAPGKQWQLLVGNTNPGGDGHYVRKNHQSQSWLLDQTLPLPSDAYSWLQQPILPLKAGDIQKIEILDESPWQIVKQTGADAPSSYVLSPMPAGRELKYASVLQGLISRIENLNFEALMPWQQTQWERYQLLKSMRISLGNGDQILLRLAKDGEHYFVSLTSDSRQTEWQNWIYQIAQFNGAQLDTNLQAMLAEPVKQDDTDSSDEGDSPR